MRRPVVSMLLISYNQQDTIEAAVRGALAQTLSGLEIIVCDDASTDRTFEVIEAVVLDYAGEHRVRVHRQPKNLGIGANLAHAVAMSQGQLLVVAAGDDVSVPDRCERLLQAWDQYDQRPDLLASDLVDIDQYGRVQGLIRPSDLSRYKSAQDWLECRPHVVGAAQAWTRRLYDHFGPLRPGVVAEDFLMAFRAICLGGAMYIPEPLVHYRRGGLSGRRRALSAQDVINGWMKNNRHSLIELPMLRADAETAQCLDVMRAWLDAESAYACLLHDVFAVTGTVERTRLVLCASTVKASKRWRLWVYAVAPFLVAPVFALKRFKQR